MSHLPRKPETENFFTVSNSNSSNKKDKFCSDEASNYEKWYYSIGFPGWSKRNCIFYYKSMFAFLNCSVLASSGYEMQDEFDIDTLSVIKKGDDFTILFQSKT